MISIYSFHDDGDGKEYVLLHIFPPTKYFGEPDNAAADYQGSGVTGFLSYGYGKMKDNMENEEFNQNLWNGLQTLVQAFFGTTIFVMAFLLNSKH